MNKKIFILINSAVLLTVTAFAAGWFVKQSFFEDTFQSTPLRVPGFKFVKPLLVCDTSFQKKLPELKNINSKLEDYINDQKKSGKIDAVSVYFQDLRTNDRITIDPYERFHPSSLGKLPVMIALYRIAESYPKVLSEKITYRNKVDYNSGSEIQPKESLKVGETYTVEKLIENMIKYSDNNSASLLINFLGLDTLKLLYADLQISIPPVDEISKVNDFVTTKDVSYFFRILYNSTYLTNELSEKAMDILNQVDYRNGLIAGLPDSVAVSHKFGTENVVNDRGNIISRELHDCGVVYHSKNPYLICVMTKSSSSNVAVLENIIKDISSISYRQVNYYSK